MARALLALLLLLVATRGTGIDRIELDLGRIEGDGWSLADLSLRLGGDLPHGFELRLARFEHPALAAPLEAIRLSCDRGAVANALIVCEQGVARIPHPLLERAEVDVGLRFEPARRQLDLTLSGLALFGGEVRLELRLAPAGWSARLTARDLRPDRLRQERAEWPGLAPQWRIDGRVALTLDSEGRGADVTRIDWRLDGQGLAFSGPEGDWLGDLIDVVATGSARRNTNGWEGSARLAAGQGELLTPFLYAGLGKRPLALRFRVHGDPALERLEISGLALELGPELRLDGRIAFALTPALRLAEAELGLAELPLATLYLDHLEPVLPLAWALREPPVGRLAAHLDIIGDARTLNVRFDGVGLVDGRSESARYAVDGLAGELHLTSGRPPRASSLGWRAIELFGRIPVGAATLRINAGEAGVELLEPATLPLFDGALVVDRFAYDRAGPASGERLVFEGIVTPISLERISAALDWPPFGGKLSGVIPAVTWRDGLIATDGVLLLRAFDGRVLLRALRAEDLFGSLPVVKGELELHDLDLEALTRTFSFGKITGRLEGGVDGLVLESWAPRAFDAWFATPPDDDSEHRISQRAVDNISRLGGAGGALSRSFLGMFEEFRYARLGIRCRLQSGVCQMDGIEPADNGYYLVRGSGLPRIDVKGFNRRADWGRLVDQLKAIARSGAPKIE